MSLRYRLARRIGRLPHFKGQSRALRTLASAERIKPFTFREPYFGLLYAGDFRSFVDWNIYFCGAHERHNLTALDGLARAAQARRGSAPVCWDIGANTGAFTLFMSRFAEAVCAFEPVAPTADQLERNVTLNGLKQVFVYRFALGAQQGSAEIRVPPRAIDCANASLLPEVAAPDWVANKVSVAVGDDLVREGAAPAPDIIKLDVEGFEPDVLAGLSRTLNERRPLIMMELSAAGRHRFGSEERLRAALYRDAGIFAVSPHDGSLQPFDFHRSFDVVAIPH